MNRDAKAWFSRKAVRVAVLSAGVVLMLGAWIPQVQAQLPPGVGSNVVARAPFVDRIDLKMKARVGGKVDVVQVQDAADVVLAEITIEPGASIGWHSHPGPAIVVVVAGTLTIYDGDDRTCTGRPYGPGEAFVDLGQGHMHDARNESTGTEDGVTVLVTYLDVPPGEGALVRDTSFESACPTD